DQQLRACGKLVQGGVNAPLDRALDWHNGPIGMARVHRVEGCLDRGACDGLELAIRMQRADRLFAEWASRPEIRAAPRSVHGATATVVSASGCSATCPSGRPVACRHGWRSASARATPSSCLALWTWELRSLPVARCAKGTSTSAIRIPLRSRSMVRPVSA